MFGPLAPQIINNFFNNIDIKILKIIYNNEKSLPKIRRFVMKYL